MKKLVSILAVMLAMPSFATDITGSSDCDNTTLGTYSAPVDMEAKWTANTINLQWYDDANDTTPVGTTCQYSSTISLPTEPTKPGYNFAGWQLRVLEYCSLEGLNYTVGTNHDANHMRWKPLNGLANGYTMQQEFGTENSSDLNDGEWSDTFSYGVIKGVSTCTGSLYGVSRRGDTLTGVDLTTEDGDQYCWCKATQYTPNGGTMCVAESPLWVYGYNFWNNCEMYCAAYCAMSIEKNFKQVDFGPFAE